MTTVSLDCSREAAADLVRAAFERTEALRLYHVGDDRAIGKTGIGPFSWGERVVVEFAEHSEGQTDLSVRGEREVPFNITASAATVEADVLDELAALADAGGANAVEGGDAADDSARERTATTATTEVPRVEDLPSGTVSMGLFLGVFLPLIFVPTMLLGTDVFDLVNEPVLSAGFLLAWFALIGAAGTLATWYYEGTLRQRLPL